jgi:hypothetical protein
MGKYHAKFLRLFEVEIEADGIDAAKAAAQRIVSQFPAGTCKPLSVIAHDYVEPPEPPTPKPDPATKRNEELARKVDTLSGPKDAA